MGRLVRRVAKGKLLDPIPNGDYQELRNFTLSRGDNSHTIKDLCSKGVMPSFSSSSHARSFVILHMLLNDGPRDMTKQVWRQRSFGQLTQTPLDADTEERPLPLSDRGTAVVMVPYFGYLRLRLDMCGSYGSDVIRHKIESPETTLKSFLGKDKASRTDILPNRYLEAVAALLDLTNMILRVAPCPDFIYPTLARDLRTLFALLNDGLITILSVFTSLSLSDAAHALLVYKRFVSHNVTAQVSQYLNQTVPQIDETLTANLESWLRSEQSQRIQFPASPDSRPSSINDSPRSARSTQIISSISKRQYRRNAASAGFQEPSGMSTSPPKSLFSVRSHRKNDTAISFDFSELHTEIQSCARSDESISRYLTRDSEDSGSGEGGTDTVSTATTCSPTFVITSTPPKSPRERDDLLDCFNDSDETSPRSLSAIRNVTKMRPPQLNLARDVDYDKNVGIALLKSASSDCSDWSQIFSPLEFDHEVNLSLSPSTAPSTAVGTGVAMGYPDSFDVRSTHSDGKWRKFFARSLA